MNHFTDIELHRWRDGGPGGDRMRIVEHLAACADCSSRYATAVRQRPLRAEPAHDVTDFVAAGYRVPKRRPWIAPLVAAAAALIVIVSIPLAMRHAQSPPDLHFRGSGIHPLAPIGTVSVRDAEFVWSSGVSVGRYRVEMGQGDRVIYTADTTHSRSSMPSSLRDLLKPGVEYWWTVTAIDTNGHGVVSSPRRTFTIVR